ncbi:MULTISPECIES: hypothetical protein [Rhizobium/Agrobacterium group]|uniref:hypothetical protein n=1 Tax=Rhizobium/Agrobacterium group TaxID=227290 RepID=UPI0011784762|nr:MULTISPECIES: hypothetical protein [Rhizobium/Agrobacterium group]MCF1482970.1 hypothetical protein [Allorhizobium ampelinum]NSZ43387.1 hypothetical protein [Agrobacterium vitis]NTA27044.1 hypothetical protein [Allorhizobium ampelinum]
MRRNRTENTPSKPWDFSRKTMFAAWIALAALTLPTAWVSAAPASGQPAPSVAASTTPGQPSVDTMETGSIALPITQKDLLTNTLARNNGVDRAVAGTVSSVHVPGYLSVLADRRVLALLSLFGLLVVWLNRAPPKNNQDL